MPAVDVASLDLKSLTPEAIDWRKFVLPADNPMRAIRIDKVVVNMGGWAERREAGEGR